MSVIKTNRSALFKKMMTLCSENRIRHKCILWAEERFTDWETFFFFYWRYNPLWLLAFLVILFHSALSSHCFLHRLTPIICISSSMSEIHLFLGLPLVLVPIGFHSNILLGVSYHPSALRDPVKLFFYFFYKSYYISIFY